MDLRDAVDARQGQGGQRLTVTVTPEGTVALPGVGSVFLQGMTLEQAKMEVDARYRASIHGIEVTVVLVTRAPRFVYVLGEVGQAGRFDLPGPTTVLQALALAQGVNARANTRQIVVLRRGEDWRLKATMLDLRGALYGRRPTPADDIWLSDSDVIIVPKTPVSLANDIIEQYATQGLYAVVPQEIIWDFVDVSGF